MDQPKTRRESKKDPKEKKHGHNNLGSQKHVRAVEALKEMKLKK
jgi:hypothetical protein